MTELLSHAIANLKIIGIYLRRAEVNLSDDYNLYNVDFSEVKVQSKRSIEKIEIMELEPIDKKNNGKKYLYSYHYSPGVRLVSLPDGDNDNSDDDERVVLTVDASFEAFYSSEIEMSKESLEAYAVCHVGKNVWPYWREYLQSTCSKMGIKNINIPFYEVDGSDLPEEDHS